MGMPSLNIDGAHHTRTLEFTISNEKSDECLRCFCRASEKKRIRMRLATLIILVLLYVSDISAGRRTPTDDLVLANRKDAGKGNDKPTIGILAQRCHDCPGRSYIAAGFCEMD